MATIDDVNAEAQGNKLKALQAMAAGGSDPYNSGQQQIRDSQSEALSTLAQSAAGAQAPAAAGELAPTVAGPGDAALAALAQGSDPYAGALSAINATGVAYGSSAPSQSALGGGGGKQFPVQMYGPYARYGGYGSQGEFDDAVLGEARRRAGVAHQGVVDQRVDLANQVQSHNRSHQLGKDLGPSTAPPIQMQGPDGTVTTLPQPHVYQPFASPEQDALARAASGAFHGVPALPHHTLPTAADKAAMAAPVVGGGVGGGVGAPSGLMSETQLFGPRGVQLSSNEDPANPLDLYQFAQQAALDHGAAPMYSTGHFSPEWGMDLALKDLAGPNDYAQQQNEYGQRTANPGGMSDEELRQQAAIQDALAGAAIKGSPEYQSGANFIDGAIQATGQGAKPPTLDDMRLQLAKLGLPSDVIVQLVKDYGGLFPTAGFVNSLPTG